MGKYFRLSFFNLMNCDFFGFRSRCQVWTRSWNVVFAVLKVIAMNSSVLWDITPHSPLKNYGHFGGSCRLRLQLATCFTLVSCFVYYWTLKMEATCSSEESVDF
jgi:hypothetical protein